MDTAFYDTDFFIRGGSAELEEAGHRRPGYNNTFVGDAHVSVFFRDIREAIVERINHYDAVFGCVAWLSDAAILDALAAGAKDVCIVVQKEDFLRPDGARPKYRDWLRRKYGMVKQRFWYQGFPEYTSISYRREKMTILAYESNDTLWPGADSMTIEPFRCAGRIVKQGEFIPRMHNKFLVFCSRDEEGYYDPIEVWTGSYNMSKTATLGFENGVGIISREIAKGFLCEFSDILLLSEPLDWQSEWIAPQLAIGMS